MSVNPPPPNPSMHPPRFSFEQRFSDWPDCIFELICCKGVTLMLVRFLLGKHDDRTFNKLPQRLCCEKCGSHPSPLRQEVLFEGWHRRVRDAPFAGLGLWGN